MTTDTILKDALQGARTIALVGASANPARPSHGVGTYLARHGFRVIPVNPGLAGQSLFGETVYPDLHSIPDAVDLVDIFRQSDAVPAIVEEALARWPDLQTIWMQLGVTHTEAANRARARGVTVIENRCTKIDHARLIAGRT
jgi:predicted CoA-binding protein